MKKNTKTTIEIQKSRSSPMKLQQPSVKSNELSLNPSINPRKTNRDIDSTSDFLGWTICSVWSLSDCEDIHYDHEPGGELAFWVG